MTESERPYNGDVAASPSPEAKDTAGYSSVQSSASGHGSLATSPAALTAPRSSLVCPGSPEVPLAARELANDNPVSLTLLPIGCAIGVDRSTADANVDGGGGTANSPAATAAEAAGGTRVVSPLPLAPRRFSECPSSPALPAAVRGLAITPGETTPTLSARRQGFGSPGPLASPAAASASTDGSPCASSPSGVAAVPTMAPVPSIGSGGRGPQIPRLPILSRTCGFASMPSEIVTQSARVDSGYRASNSLTLPISPRGTTRTLAAGSPTLPIPSRDGGGLMLPISARGCAGSPATPQLPIPSRVSGGSGAGLRLPISARGCGGSPASSLFPVAARSGGSNLSAVASRSPTMPVSSCGGSPFETSPGVVQTTQRGSGVSCTTASSPQWTGGAPSPFSPWIKQHSLEDGAYPMPTSPLSPKPVFLDLYSLGDVLGQGAFGVVYLCIDRHTEQELAVKMVDKVETPVEDILREAALHKTLDHPRIVKVHAVFVESCFICIVMDMYSGDLIEAIMAWFEARGTVIAREVVHVSRQMVEAVEYLHSRNVAHRDVKGDNFLLDREDIIDPECRIVLTDFGAACSVSGPDDRLEQQVGTREYWSPETFDEDYGLKADVWALGISMYGLFEGCLPFQGELEIRKSEASMHRGIPEECEDFVLQMLRKDEQERPTAAQVLEHWWLESGADSPVRHAVKKMLSVKLPKGIANAGVSERRAELVGRLLESASKKPGEEAPAPQSYWERRFKVTDRPTGDSRTFEWYPEVEAEHLLLSAPGTLHLVDSAMHSAPRDNVAGGNGAGDHEMLAVPVVGKMLAEHGIDTSLFGRDNGKTLEDFAKELQGGTARLMLDANAHKKLVRVVDVVLLRLSCQNGELGDGYLVEVDSDGSPADRRLPGSKKEPHENTRMAARRILENHLDSSLFQVTMAFDAIEVTEEQHESTSFRGVNTVYRMEIVDGRLSWKDPVTLDRILESSKVQAKASRSKMRGLVWMNSKQLKGSAHALPKPAKKVSTLVQAPVGLEEDAVRDFLETSRIDTSRFGQGHAKSLGDLASELIKGESALVGRPDGEGIMRVVDMIVLRLRREDTGELLLQVAGTFPDGTVDESLRPPAGKRRPDENEFLAAQRTVARTLQMNPNCVSFERDAVQIMSEEMDSFHYPGLRTLYRKRILTAVVHSPDSVQSHVGED
eukprot:TRINITY_DN21284_c0_g1_i1.p1 TRINITY_DN21284_c0_g1~~TRINITY_DN21284_c0_g1_i1.p1  ORF type:complete len:1265 (+),score=242.72 TRINITY_DN21284_c0_g1_i1:263-3796(+)